MPNCVADSTNSFVDDTEQEFRSKVEKIRQIGGDSWLKIFDEIQGEAEMTQVCSKAQHLHSDNLLVVKNKQKERKKNKKVKCQSFTKFVCGTGERPAQW